MGKSTIPAYRVEYTTQQHGAAWWSSMIWHVKSGVNRTGYGMPTDANVEKWRVAMNRSFQPGGSNAHLADARGYVPHINKVRVIEQKSGRVVATAKMPMFEAV